MRIHMALVMNWITTDASLGAEMGFLPLTTVTASNVSTTDVGEDWMLLTIAPPALCQETTLIGTNLAGGIRFDIRAKRKLEELNQHPFFVIKNSGVGAGQLNYGFRCRTLLALP